MVPIPVLTSLFAGAGSSLNFVTPRATVPANCVATDYRPFIPADSEEVQFPEGQSTLMITLGVGLQNYTCTDSGTYELIGSIATLFDTTCVHDPEYSQLPTKSFEIWSASELTDVPSVETLFPDLPIFGDHFWQPRGDGRNPVFDARARTQQGNPDAFIMDEIIGHLKAPTGGTDVDWYYLENIEGGLSKSMLRLETRGGLPPDSCTPGSDELRIKYTAYYYFLG